MGTTGSSNFNGRPPLSSYTIDGNYLLNYEPESQPSPHWEYRQQFYKSPLLSNDRHTLVVTNLRDNCDLFLLDYFVVESSTSLSPTPTPTPTSLGKLVPIHRIPTATLTGIITAAVIGIILVITIIYFLCRRRRPKSNANMISICLYFSIFFGYV